MSDNRSFVETMVGGFSPMGGGGAVGGAGGAAGAGGAGAGAAAGTALAAAAAAFGGVAVTVLVVADKEVCREYFDHEWLHLVRRHIEDVANVDPATGKYDIEFVLCLQHEFEHQRHLVSRLKSGFRRETLSIRLEPKWRHFDHLLVRVGNNLLPFSSSMCVLSPNVFNELGVNHVAKSVGFGSGSKLLAKLRNIAENSALLSSIMPSAHAKPVRDMFQMTSIQQTLSEIVNDTDDPSVGILRDADKGALMLFINRIQSLDAPSPPVTSSGCGGGSGGGLHHSSSAGGSDAAAAAASSELAPFLPHGLIHHCPCKK